jgi:hypothetical protein
MNVKGLNRVQPFSLASKSSRLTDANESRPPVADSDRCLLGQRPVSTEGVNATVVEQAKPEVFLDPLSEVPAKSMSPLGDILRLPGEKIRGALVDSQLALRSAGLRNRKFRDGLQKLSKDGLTVKDLKAYESLWAQRGPLHADEVTAMMETYRTLDAPEALVGFYERMETSIPELSNYEVPLEFYVESLGQLGQHADVIDRGESLMFKRAEMITLPSQSPKRLLSQKAPRELGLSSQLLQHIGEAYRGLHLQAEGAIDSIVEGADLLKSVEGLTGWKSEDPQSSQKILRESAGEVLRAKQPGDKFLDAVQTLTGQTLKGPLRAAVAATLEPLQKKVQNTDLDRGMAQRVWRGSGEALGSDLAKLSQTALEMSRDYHLEAFQIDFEPHVGLALMQDEAALGNSERAEQLRPILAAVVAPRPGQREQNSELLSVRNALGIESVTKPVGELTSKEKATQRIYQIGRQLSHEASSRYVAGSWQFVDRGGTVDMPINRPTIHAYRHINDKLGLQRFDQPGQVRQVCEKLHELLDEQFELVDPATGKRPMENLQSAVHHHRDDIAQQRHDVCQSRVLGNSSTNPHVEMFFGKGDCRSTSINFALPFGIWKSDQEHGALRQALDASFKGDTESRDKHLESAREWSKMEVLMIDLTFLGNMRLETDAQGQPMKYRVLTDSNGNPLHSEELLRDKDGKPQAIEDHSFPVLVKLDDDNQVEGLTAVDPFYRDLYPLGWQPLDPQEVLDEEKGFFLGSMGVAASNGTPLLVWGKPTPYSGSPAKASTGEYGAESFGGRAISVGDPTPFLKKHSPMDDFAEAMTGLVTGITKRKLLESMTTERRGEAVAGTHHRWFQARLGDQQSSAQPFLGWAGERTICTPELKAMDNDELRRSLAAAGHAVQISEAKLEAIRAADIGTVLLDPNFRPLHQLENSDAREKALAVDTIALARYMEDIRGGEELGRVLSDGLKGRDPVGSSVLLKTLELAELSARLSGVEATDGKQSWHAKYEFDPQQGLDIGRWTSLAKQIKTEGLMTAEQVVQSGATPDPVGKLVLTHYVHGFRESQEDLGQVLDGLASGEDVLGIRQLAVLGHLAEQTAGQNPTGDPTTKVELAARGRAVMEWLNGSL